jgi:hypothetical protein
MFTDYDTQRHRGTEGFLSKRLVPLCLCASVCCVQWLSIANAQELLDRIVARVGNTVITLTDVNAAMAFDVAPAEDFDTAAQQMIERQLLLAEVARFAPPDPAAPAIDAEVAGMKMRAGAGLAQVMQSTGVGEERIRELARDTLRIQGYINQRFGPAAQRTPGEVEQWLKDLRGRATVSVPASR